MNENTVLDKPVSVLTYFAVLFVAFIGFIGVSVPFPTMVMVFLDDNSPFLGPESDAWRTIITGCALATYPLMQSFGSPVIGQLSDYYGRKKVLLISLLITAAGYALTSFATLAGNLWLFFCGRIICGLVQGNIAIAMATASDLASGAAKKRFFANINAGAYLAFLVGPSLGGWLANPKNTWWCGFHTPFAFSAICIALAVVVTALLFPALAPTQKEKRPFSLLSQFSEIKGSFTQNSIRPYFLIAVFLFLGINIFFEFNNVFLVSAFEFEVQHVGFFISFFSVFSIGAQLSFNSSLFHKINPLSLLLGAMVGLMIAIAAFASLEQAYFIWLLLPVIAICFAFSKTSFQLLVSENAARDNQGGAIGLAEGLDVFCDSIAAFMGGIFADLHYRLPLYMASLMVLSSFLLVRFFLKQRVFSRVFFLK